MWAHRFWHDFVYFNAAVNGGRIIRLDYHARCFTDALLPVSARWVTHVRRNDDLLLGNVNSLEITVPRTAGDGAHRNVWMEHVVFNVRPTT